MRTSSVNSLIKLVHPKYANPKIHICPPSQFIEMKHTNHNFMRSTFLNTSKSLYYFSNSNKPPANQP